MHRMENLIPKHGVLHLMMIRLNAFINPAGTCQEAMCLKSTLLSDFCIRALGGGKTNANQRQGSSKEASGSVVWLHPTQECKATIHLHHPQQFPSQVRQELLQLSNLRLVSQILMYTLLANSPRQLLATLYKAMSDQFPSELTWKFDVAGPLERRAAYRRGSSKGARSGIRKDFWAFWKQTPTKLWNTLWTLATAWSYLES